MALSSRITLIAALALAAFQAQAVNVTVAYQTSAEPAKVAQADNTFAKASGATVDWRKFDSGASIVRALASGDVQIGNLGSSPLAVAATQQVPIEVFLLASKLGNSEALVVKKSITKPQDLIGKRIAVPFISTTHYSLLSALKHWGLNRARCRSSTCSRRRLLPPGSAATLTAPTSGRRRLTRWKKRHGSHRLVAGGRVGRADAGRVGGTQRLCRKAS
jgi:taurine transport system substrate-binding protein